VRRTVVDAELADAVRALLDLPGGRGSFGSRVTRPREPDGGILNEYLATHMGNGYTADFRTWGGTLEAAIGFAEHGPPESAADERRVVAAVMRRVASELGNTPAVARASYVSPAVVEQWREGQTLDHFRGAHCAVGARPRKRRRRCSRRPPGRPRPSGLTADGGRRRRNDTAKSSQRAGRRSRLTSPIDRAAGVRCGRGTPRQTVPMGRRRAEGDVDARRSGNPC
jgi:hypothetical protein